MRTYAPADPSTVLDRLLEEPSLARGVVHHEVIPAREASHAPMPDWLDPRIVAGLATRGIERLYTHQAEAHRGGPRRRGRRRRHADGVGQDAVLRAAGAAGDRGGSVGPGAVPVPDQGARPGPGRPSSASSRAAAGPVDHHLDLRRRHAGARSARPSGRPARSSSPTRTCSTRRSCPTTRSGSSCSSSSSSSSSTSCTRTAACSAATSPTSCAGCSGSAPTTAASR